MPLQASHDPARGDALDYNRSTQDGRHRSHRFLGANQAIPVMLKYRYDKGLISGTICAGGSLGTIIPPSVVVVLLGPPGVGKGAQGALLAEWLGWERVVTGDLLRAARREGTELGRRAQAFMDAGDLVPDGLIVDMVRERLGQHQDLEVLRKLSEPGHPLAHWRAKLEPAIAARKRRHVAAARKIAARLFVDKPNAFRRRLNVMWKTS